MKKWTALSASDENNRWNLLSDFIKRAGVENEFVPWTDKIEDFPDLSPLKDFNHMRLSMSLAPLVVRHVKAQSSWISLLGVTDGMVNAPNGWWPLCALYESLGQIIVQLGRDLDNRGNVLVAGAGGRARASIAALFKGGFSKFLFTSFNESEAQLLIKDMKFRFLGIDIRWVPREKIILLPAETSVLVNCTPSIEENALIRELSYLNFLRRPGFLFDLNRESNRGILVEEAQQVDVKIITGQEIGARTDVLWAKWAFQATLEIQTYEQEYFKILGL
jgi:hypothetical protein